MITVIILFSIGIMVSLGFLLSKYGEDIDMRIATSVELIILSTLFGITITLFSTPTIEGYVNGRGETKVVTIVKDKDGEIIKCDTLYYKN